MSNQERFAVSHTKLFFQNFDIKGDQDQDQAHHERFHQN